MIERGTGRPTARGYRLDGKKLPSVTEILGRFKESGGLIRWAYKQGLDGLELYGKSNQACEIGTVVHDAVETYIHGGEGEAVISSSPLSDEAKNDASMSFGAFLAWEKEANVEWLATEVPIVSATHGFAGTIDAVANIGDDRPCIFEIKSAKALYADNLLQVAAYSLLWEEARLQPIHVAHICRFSKTSGAFEHRRWRNLVLAKAYFLKLVDCFGDDKALKEML